MPIEVLTASDAASALQLCDTQAIHLVLLDVGLPDLSGFELCARIRANGRLGAVPIFMPTGRGDVDAKAEAFRAGADDYLVKPVVAEELVLRVVRALERNYGARVPATPAPTLEPTLEPTMNAPSEPTTNVRTEPTTNAVPGLTTNAVTAPTTVEPAAASEPLVAVELPPLPLPEPAARARARRRCRRLCARWRPIPSRGPAPRCSRGSPPRRSQHRRRRPRQRSDVRTRGANFSAARGHSDNRARARGDGDLR